jgi:hypothetical protein
MFNRRERYMSQGWASQAISRVESSPSHFVKASSRVESSHQDFRVESSRVIRIFLSRLESPRFSTRAESSRVESSQVAFVIFTFSVYLIKNVNKTSFYHTLSVS